MKLILAGQGEAAKPFTELLFNCTRDRKCQREFFVPVPAFEDLVFYADLPGKPSLIAIDVINVCAAGEEAEGSAVSTNYVTGTKPDATWYGVFGGLVVTPPVGVTYNKFFFRFSFTIGGLVYIFYSQQIEFPYCGDLMPIRGCYPNEEIGTDAFDCNEVYYGFPNNEDPTGDPEYRYIHKAWLRDAEVIEQRNKMTFSAFNNKRIYKSVFNREYLLEFEIVPTFYKDELIGIFNRGNVQLDQGPGFVEWKLAETQDISMISNDAKLWKLDMILDSECKNTFGCKPADCVLPEPPPPECPCIPTGVTASIEVTPECVFAGITSGGDLSNGEVGVPYSHTIVLYGTAPFTLSSIVKPSWMTITVVGSTIEITGTPDADGDDIPVSFNIDNCDEASLPFSDTIDIDPFVCTEVGWDPEASLPDAQVGVPYLHDIPLTGSLPMAIVPFSTTKPSWMTIAIVSGNVLRFSGTPDASADDFAIAVSISNCAETNLDIATTLDVLESIEGSMTFANCPDAPDAITDIQFNGVSVIPTSGSFPMSPGDVMDFLVTNPGALGTLVVFLAGNTSGQPVRVEGTDSQPFTSCQDGIGGSTRTLTFFTIDNTNNISLDLLCGICP